MKQTPLQKRAARKERNSSMVDMNLVSLIDVFTILIFFLLSNSSDVETLPSSKAVRLPESTAEESPRETLAVLVSGADIVVDGRRVASVPEVLASPDNLIAPLKAVLDELSQRQVVKSKNSDKARTVTIMGDKDIPYQLLRKVMYTCARANYADVSFAVTRKAQS